jgi:hypothetical protein
MNGTLVLLSLWAWLGADILAPQTYQTAVKAYQTKEYKRSAALFHKILAALEKKASEAKPTSKKRHYLVLGQCDLHYYLAQIASEQGKKQAACLRYLTLNKRLKTVPKGWTAWPVQPHLLEHMGKGRAQLAAMCAKVPSPLVLSVIPAGATVYYRANAKQPWKKQSVKMISMYGPQGFVKIEKQGYLPVVQKVSLARWHTKSIKITLKKEPPRKVPPKRIAIVRKRPVPVKPSVPLHQNPLFWLAVGGGVVLVAGGVVAGVIAANPQILEPPTLEINTKEPLFKPE